MAVWGRGKRALEHSGRPGLPAVCGSFLFPPSAHQAEADVRGRAEEGRPKRAVYQLLPLPF